MEKLINSIESFKIKILLISPQSRLSFARHYKMSEKEIQQFFSWLGK